MKVSKILYNLLLFSICMFLCDKGYSQATTAGFGNAFTAAPEYIGWRSLTGLPLDIKNEDDQPLFFYTNAGANTYNERKMTIWRRTLNGIEHGAVSIHSTNASNITLPRSILHLGNNSFPGIAGWRNWMDIGTFYGKGTDFAYMGTMERDGDSTSIQGDHNDAVIVWGDNINAPDGADNFRILFSAPFNGASTGTAGSYNTLEVSRYSPLGRVGIGNFSATANGGGSGIQPLRRLEIYGENNDTLLNAQAPQLRLTHTPNASVNLGVNTDFQSMSTGDLFINPRSAGGNRFVGINTSTPNGTLEINSNGTYTAGAIGSSGLFFTDLRSGNGASSGNGKVLSVNSSGEVILVGDVGGGNLTGDNSVCTFLANYVPRFYSNTSLGCSQIYDNGSTTVGIGMAAGGNTAFRVHMKGDFLIQPENSTDRGDIYMQDASVGNRRVFAMYGSGGNSTLAIGLGAGGSSGSATRSLYVGNNAGNLTDDETRNTFVGASAGEVWTGTSTTGWNTMIGSAAGVAMTGGNHNTFLGERAGNTFASGDSNTFVGAEAGNGGLTGAARNNILIGNSAVVNATNGTENIVIGVEAQALQTGGTSTNRVSIGYKNRVSCDNCFTMASQIGTNFTEQHVGIGTDNPNRRYLLMVWVREEFLNYMSLDGIMVVLQQT